MKKFIIAVLAVFTAFSVYFIKGSALKAADPEGTNYVTEEQTFEFTVLSMNSIDEIDFVDFLDKVARKEDNTIDNLIDVKYNNTSIKEDPNYSVKIYKKSASDTWNMLSITTNDEDSPKEFNVSSPDYDNNYTVTMEGFNTNDVFLITLEVEIPDVLNPYPYWHRGESDKYYFYIGDLSTTGVENMLLESPNTLALEYALPDDPDTWIKVENYAENTDPDNPDYTKVMINTTSTDTTLTRSLQIPDTEAEDTTYTSYAEYTKELASTDDIAFRVPIDYTVTYYLGEEVYKSEKVAALEPLTAPTNPAVEGKVFKGWYKDEECTEAFLPDTLVSEDLNLYAKFDLINDSTGTPLIPGIEDNNQSRIIIAILVVAGILIAAGVFTTINTKQRKSKKR